MSLTQIYERQIAINYKKYVKFILKNMTNLPPNYLNTKYVRVNVGRKRQLHIVNRQVN